jgi:hypothetical protein
MKINEDTENVMVGDAVIVVENRWLGNKKVEG